MKTIQSKLLVIFGAFIIVSMTNLSFIICDDKPYQYPSDNVMLAGDQAIQDDNDILVGTNNSLTNLGYKPIPDIYASYDNDGKINDSLQYRE